MYTTLDKPIGNIGQKAKNLSKILCDLGSSKAFKIPKTIILTTDFYFRFLKHKTTKIDSGNKANITKLPVRMQTDIIKYIRKNFRDKKLVIRSSATCEDSILFSGAGQYKSFINLKTNKEIENAIIKIYLSFSSENARLYSKINGVDLKKEGMAILIQEMAPVKMSGVLFTINPVTGNREFLIEYTSGLGVDVVSGNKNVKRKIIAKVNSYEGNKIFRKLISIGIKIEKIFGCPQDIEWGTDGKEIYIFQSRPIIVFKFAQKFEKLYNKTGQYFVGKVISKGIEIGYLENFKNSKGNSILLQNDFLTSNDINDIVNSFGVVLTTGGYLSHFANILREFQKPAVLLSENKTLNNLEGKLIVIDAFTGRIYLWDKLNSKEINFYFWKYLEYKAELKNSKFEKWFGIKNVESNVNYEEVFFGIDKNEVIKNLKNLNARRIFGGRQRIITYDYGDNSLIDGKVVLRIQYSGKNVRVQAKKLYNTKNNYRKEEEFLIIFDNLANAINFVNRKGLIKTGYQERKITSYKLDRVLFNVIEWPGSPPYLGVEANSVNELSLCCKKANLDREKGVCIDGKKIFEKFNLSLNSCKF